MIGLEEHFAYKANACIGIFNSIIFFLIQYYMWRAVFDSANGVFHDITEEKYIMYLFSGILISQVTNHTVDRKLFLDIKTGNIAFRLLKPLGLVKQLFLSALGRQIGLVLSFVPLLIIISHYFLLSFCLSSNLYYFIISTILALILSFQISFLFGLLAFYTTNTWGLYLLRLNLFPILSGQIIAISVLKSMSENLDGLLAGIAGCLYAISYITPLQSTFNTPSGIASEIIQGNAVLFHIFLQIFWIFLIGIFVNRIELTLLRTYEIQGS
ncbi:ABC transporter permease [Photorhabdus tasmaniensis]|uniref:ABC transporter permease n=1 Tax=Photorhabdus tasmaniensis TaxID=1004159 RepID=UPI0040428AA1